MVEEKECGCNDIVFHTTSYFKIREILEEGLKPGKEVDLPIPERIGKIYAYPSIEDFLKSPLKESGLLAICVDNRKVKVSDDYDAFKQDEESWRKKLITLEEYRNLSEEERSKYKYPEVVISPEDICMENVIGVFIYAGGEVIPDSCLLCRTNLCKD